MSHNKTGLRLALIGALVLGSMSATVFALQVNAASARSHTTYHTTYYSDASHAFVVGEKGTDCDGASQVWGNSSNHYSRSTESCTAR